jgi:hypothetical protein
VSDWGNNYNPNTANPDPAPGRRSTAIHPLVRRVFELETTVQFLLGRSGLGPWVPGEDLDERVLLWAFKSRISWCCAAPFARKPGQGTEEFCAECQCHLGHFHAPVSR